MEKYIVFSNNKSLEQVSLNSEYIANSTDDAKSQHIGYGLPEGEEITLVISKKGLEKKWSEGLGFYDTNFIRKESA